MKILNFFKDRQEKRDAVDYKNGYNWAKVQIKLGKTKDFIEGYTYGSVDMFDLGAKSYIEELK